jgi:hypothetical protein
VLTSRDDALKLIDVLGAPEHLKTHIQLVGEAADLIIKKCDDMEFPIDGNFVRIGVAIHDVGKIVHANEMTRAGSEHEPEGEKILLQQGVDPAIARCCLSHARWASMECSTEELLIALADKLWKGKRVEELELKIIDRLALLGGSDRWDIFAELDGYFEEIAADGHERLQRSVSG